MADDGGRRAFRDWLWAALQRAEGEGRHAELIEALKRFLKNKKL